MFHLIGGVVIGIFAAFLWWALRYGIPELIAQRRAERRQRSKLCLAIMVSIVPTAAHAEWKTIGESSDGGPIQIEAAAIKPHGYPDINRIVSYAPLRYANINYTEIWVRYYSAASSSITERDLMAYDCKDKFAIVQSVVFDDEGKIKTSADISAKAEMIGLGRFLTRIAPDTVAEMVQAYACPKKR